MQKEVNIQVGYELVPYMNNSFLDLLSEMNSKKENKFYFHIEDNMSLKSTEYTIEINGWDKAMYFEKSSTKEDSVKKLADEIKIAVFDFC